MKKKVIFVFLILVIFGTVQVFAQQDKGYIKPTFSFGVLSLNPENGSKETMPGFAMDVDFVSSLGLTFGMQIVFGWNDNIAITNFPFGGGYTYTADSWSVGGKWMAVPPIDGNSGGMGFDFNGTYYFYKDIGVTAGLSYFFSIGADDGEKWKIFGFKAGLSAKI